VAPETLRQPILRRLGAHEWRAYRDLRLRALSDAPTAFGSLLRFEQPRSDAEWAERLSSGATSELNIPLVAAHGDELVGLAWGRIDPSMPETAHLFQMWVAPSSRGLGCGAMLLDAVVTWARDAKARCVVLGVTRGDTAAKRLYDRAGFRPFGDPEPLRPGSKLLSQPMRLEL
jgi:ribosomal protein S18 acetylase RimI-like enzyme